MKKPKVLTPEEIERKNALRFRLFYVLILCDILLAIYLIYQIVTMIVG